MLAMRRFGTKHRTNHLLLQVNMIPESLFWKQETGIGACPAILQAFEVPYKTPNKTLTEKDFCFVWAKPHHQGSQCVQGLGMDPLDYGIDKMAPGSPSWL